MTLWQKVGFGLGILFLAVLTGIIYWFSPKTAFPGANGANPGSSTPLVATPLQKFFQNNEPLNILLLGYGGGNHDGAYLTDSMMLARIVPAKKIIYLISIPRDLWVKIPTAGMVVEPMKINAAYAIGVDDSDYPNKLANYTGDNGGGNLAKMVVSQVTGLPISNYLALDFSGFVKSIDVLGGVDINVEIAFDDPEYPIDGKETDTCGLSDNDIKARAATMAAQLPKAFSCRYKNLHFAKGLQHMTGEQALDYVRSRHSLQDGTDFGRAKRQRNLIAAVKSKLLQVNSLPKFLPFLASIKNNYATDFSAGDIAAFIPKAAILGQYQIQSLALTDENFLNLTWSPDGQSILAPKAGVDNFSEIQQWLSAPVINPNASSSAVKADH